MTEQTAEQTTVIEFLQTQLGSIFPTSGLNVRTRNILGRNVHFTYTNANSIEDCANRIWENDPAFMSFAIWGSPSEGFYIEKPSTHTHVLKNAGIKRFATIKGKTEMDCAVKLVEFMRKNATAFLSLGLSR
jgi:hypothetical protein